MRRKRVRPALTDLHSDLKPFQYRHLLDLTKCKQIHWSLSGTNPETWRLVVTEVPRSSGVDASGEFPSALVIAH